MKVLSVVGARPQFVKAAVVTQALREAGVEEVMVHTGQHYDAGMSEVFFAELGIPAPAHNLGVGSGSHAAQTAGALTGLERLCLSERPDAVLVYGDTNATLSGALAAAKLRLPVAHVEAGLRSFDRRMPEEVNRVVADHLSRWLFCPTATAVDNLSREGITAGVVLVGDVMYDAVLRFGARAAAVSTVLERLRVTPGAFVLATIHRDFNTDAPDRLAGIVNGLLGCGLPVVFPAHPRVRKCLERGGWLARLEAEPRLRLCEPVGYLDMVRLEAAARVILTDSGGVQKEAFFHGVPCVTVRDTTEWVETVTAGWNRLAPAEAGSVAQALLAAGPPAGAHRPAFYGAGDAAGRIADILKRESAG